MKLNKFIAVIISVILLLLCSGCSLNFFSVESLMSPPLQSGKNGEVEKAFKKLMAEKNIQLRTPASGEFQTSFVLFDINSDGSEEAFVFYTDSSIDTSVRLSFMECINETWVISADIKGAGSGVFDVSFADLNNNGKYEVLVGWSLFDSKASKIISVYEVADGDNGIFTLNTLGTEYYNAKVITDFNNDNKDDLLLIYLDDSGDVQKSYFRCFALSDSDSFVKYGDIKLDSHISLVSKIQTDDVTVNGEKVKRIFVDCIKNETSMFTELLYWDTDELKPVKAIKNTASSTLRSSKVHSSDIDGDGLLEIPSNIKLLGDEKQLTVKQGDNQYTFTMLEWLNEYSDKSEGTVKTIFNPLDLYFYRITRVNEVTVYYDVLKQALKFCIWDSEEELIKDELLSIFFRKDNEETDVEGKKLLKTEAGTFYYSITPHGEDFGVTDEGVKSSFIIIN